MRSFLPLALLALGGSSCNGPAAAARDFVDPYRIVVGVGTGVGVRFNTLGLVHTGLMFGVKPDQAAIGWKYGEGFAFQPARDDTIRAEFDQSWIVKTTSVFDLNYSRGGYDLARQSFFLLPAVFSRVDSAQPDDVTWLVPDEGVQLEPPHWIWSPRAFRDQRFAQVHAFDIEAEAMFAVYIDTGFSPGEVLDFWTSLFGFDLAKDDDR